MTLLFASHGSETAQERTDRRQEDDFQGVAYLNVMDIRLAAACGGVDVGL
jgi:hypothetical protein